MQGFRHTALPPQYYSGDLPMKGDIENIYEANIDYREGTLDSDRGLSSYINGWYGRGQKTNPKHLLPRIYRQPDNSPLDIMDLRKLD